MSRVALFAVPAALLVLGCNGADSIPAEEAGEKVEIQVQLDGSGISSSLTWDAVVLSASPAEDSIIMLAMHQPEGFNSGPFQQTVRWQLPPGRQDLVAELWSGAIVIARGTAEAAVDDGAAATIVLTQTVVVDDGTGAGAP